jgi:hypothetical protein
MAGMKVVLIKCDEAGFLVLDDLKAKAEQHKDNLAALMVTYPSTYGVFEEGVKEACKIIHANGGQVYMDGANMNAQGKSPLLLFSSSSLLLSSFLSRSLSSFLTPYIFFRPSLP